LDFYYCVNKLESAGAISHTIVSDLKPLCTFSPSSPNYKKKCLRIDARKEYILSHFAYLHREMKNLILESPISNSTVCFYDAALIGLLSLLSEPLHLHQLKEKFGADHSWIEIFVEHLLCEDFVEECNQKEDKTFALWNFHDLLFHSRTRKGRTDHAFGATYRLKEKIKSPPALKPIFQGDVIQLSHSYREAQGEWETSIFKTLEKRKSIRKHDENNPISDCELSEFLFRVARVQEKRSVKLSEGLVYEIAKRPYPSAGGCYELELYLTIRCCQGISPGLYYYDAAEHRLRRISGPTEKTKTLLRDAWLANGESEPQILITISARFQRITWVYESLAYSSILKDVGVLFQTMYLVATAMGLAPCALGCGDSDLFAAMVGTDYYAETSVGEFMIGKPIS
jgi:SagB-type dehydrogenase family enzyme